MATGQMLSEAQNDRPSTSLLRLNIGQRCPSMMFRHIADRRTQEG
jgi:hypothetical protein